MAQNNNRINYKIFVDTDSGTASVRKLNGEIVAGAVPLDKLRSKFGNFAKTVNAADFNKFNRGLKSATSANAGLSRASGGATTSVLELGRVVSDAPYGIRGMANNVSQLASNMLFTAQQVDATTGKVIGFSGVLKQMGRVFMGPLGLLFLIQGAIALLDGFLGSSKKAKNATEDFSSSISESASKLLILNQVLQSSSTSMSDKKEIISDVNSEFKDLNLSLDDNGSLTDASRIALDKLTSSMVKNAKAQAIMKKITDEQSTIVDIEIEQAAKISKAAAENTLGVGVFKGTLDGLIKKQNEYIERYQRQIDYNNLTEQKKKDAMESYMNTTTMQRFQYLKDFRKDDLEDAKKNIAQMTALLTGTDLDTYVYDFNRKKKGGRSRKISPFKTPEELDIDIKNSESAQIKLQKRIQDARTKKELNDKLSEATSEEARRKIREEYQVKKLQNQLDTEQKILDLKINTEKAVVKTKTQNHIDDIKRAQELFVYKMDLEEKAGRITKAQRDELVDNSKGKLYGAIIQAEEESQISLSQITSKYAPVLAFLEEFKKTQMDALTSGFGGKTDDAKKKLEDMMFYAKQFMKVQQSLTSFLDGEFQRQITLERNKTNALNNELRERLNNENISAGERKSIQLKIARNDEALRKKQEKIEKKRFKLNKAANIAQATISTYLAANRVLAETKGGTLARFVAMAATISAGLLNVAAIARQDFQSSAGATIPAGALGAGGNGEGESRKFNFNLAGSTQSNQLTQSIASQLNQPIQTYVVSSEITSQQQLDLNISNTATIG